MLDLLVRAGNTDFNSSHLGNIESNKIWGVPVERFGILLLPIFLLVGLAQIYLGYIGIEYHLGFWAAVAAIAATFMFRFMLPITIGSFFGAVDVLGWPWWGGVLIAAPGLLFIAPAMVMAALEPLFSKR